MNNFILEHAIIDVGVILPFNTGSLYNSVSTSDTISIQSQTDTHIRSDQNNVYTLLSCGSNFLVEEKFIVNHLIFLVLVR